VEDLARGGELMAELYERRRRGGNHRVEICENQPDPPPPGVACMAASSEEYALIFTASETRQESIIESQNFCFDLFEILCFGDDLWNSAQRKQR